MVTREKIKETLQKYKANKDKYHISRIGYFGSYARGDFNDQSDLDIVIVLDKPNLFLMGSIKSDIEDELGIKVDVIRLHKNMNPYLSKRINKEAVYV